MRMTDPPSGLNKAFAKAVCVAQARGQIGPLSVTMARELGKAIGDDPAFKTELDEIRRAHEQNMRQFREAFALDDAVYINASDGKVVRPS